MLSVHSLRIVGSSRAVLHPCWLTTNRLPVSKAVTCTAHCMSTSLHRKGTWHSNMNFRALRKERELFYLTNPPASVRNYCTSQIKLNCWNCKHLLDKRPAFFCVSCKAVQPPVEGTSYFKIMDCDYTFTLDTQRLQKTYLQLQRSLHPDNFSQKSVDKRFHHKLLNCDLGVYLDRLGKKEQEYSESQSALVNKAYNTLLKPLSRGLYMLEVEGMNIEEGTDSGADSNFLMKLMEINEALDEAQTPEEADKIGQDTKGKLADLTVQIDAALRKGELQAAKDILVQMKYYANIEEKVKEKLSEFM